MTQIQIFDSSNSSSYFLEYTIKDWNQLTDIKDTLKDILNSKFNTEIVYSFGPKLTKQLFPNDCPEDLIDFPTYKGPKFSMPSTQSDIFVWFQSTREDLIFKDVLSIGKSFAPYLKIDTDERGFRYLDSRDLIGFVDGSANPKGERILPSTLIADDKKGAKGSIVMMQKWKHKLEKFESLSIKEQENIVGRTKEESIELYGERKKKDSHVTRTDLKKDGKGLKIWRRSYPYGNLRDHGLMYLAFSTDLERLDMQLSSMVGANDGVNDKLMNFSTAVSGSYYFCLPLEVLEGLK